MSVPCGGIAAAPGILLIPCPRDHFCEQINNAHLIHDHSTGRSSTRLHAPPGGSNSMGTSFGWSDEPVQVQRKNALV
jgi:hypothetical protein